MSAAARSSTTPADRVTCEHSARCGGCPLIDLTYGAQLEAKGKHVASALALYPALAGVEVSPVEPADPITGYRTRAKLVVGPAGELGLYTRAGRHEVVDIPGCRVLAPVLAAVAAELRKRIAAAMREGGPLAPATPGSRGALRAVDLREVRGGEGPAAALVTWVFDRERAPDQKTLEGAAADLRRALPVVAGVAANFQHPDAAQILGSETLHLAGARSAPDRLGASVHLASFGSFVQAHRAQAAKIHDVVAKAAARSGPAPRVLDLYGGSGAIALGLAARGARVVLVESFGPAAKRAAEAAEQQHLALEVLREDAGRAVELLAQRSERFDAAVLNPPRRGATPAAREGLAQIAPDTIIYVSCDPETLARDLARFAALGYRAVKVQPFDMIPLTAEVEVVAVLTRGAPPAPRVLYEDAAIVVVDKDPHEPVAPDAGAQVCLTDRVRALPGGANVRAILTLDADASGIVVFARDADHAGPWSKALASPDARVEFVVAVRGILRAKGSIVRPLRGTGRPKPPRVRYVRTSVVGGHSVARVTTDTPGTEAIRAHLASVGHPVLGDTRRGDRATNKHFAEKVGLDRAFVQRARVELLHPDTGQPLVVDSPLPGDLSAVTDRLARSSR
jgi:23S rRNA (uracil1939-C5)-methyltransferase